MLTLRDIMKRLCFIHHAAAKSVCKIFICLTDFFLNAADEKIKIIFIVLNKYV